MFSKIKIVTIFSIAIIVAYRCSVALYIPTEQVALKTGTSLDTLVMGRNLYIKNCGSCHNLYLPEKFTNEEWQKSMIQMRKLAKIDNQQSNTILKYINSANKK